MSAPDAGVDDDLDALIHRADLDALIRLVDQRTAAADWAGLRRAADRCRAAVRTGRQLWPAATLARYRLALDAPPDWAAPVVDDDDPGPFTIGPLTEVVAQVHEWSSLAGLLTTGPAAALVAHERVLRGDEPDPESTAALPPVLDVPYALAPWEPRYPLATYSDDGVDAPAPAVPTLRSAWQATTHGTRLEDDAVDLAVRQLVETWTVSSNGHAEVVCVEGDASAAIGGLGVSRWRVAELDLTGALAWLAWAGASGGAHGRRRGAALGRFGALWVVATLLDLADDWPVPVDTLGAEAAMLRWVWWDAGEPPTGWRLQLAVEDPAEGVAWAINARDDA